MFRFMIAPVVISGNQMKVLEDPSFIEATSFDEAGHIATVNFPDCQIMVIRVGRILNVGAENALPLGQGAGS